MPFHFEFPNIFLNFPLASALLTVNQRCKIHISIRLCFLIVFAFVWAMPATIAQNFDFARYSIEEGLSQSYVTTIFQDSRGYLWVGTSGGGLCQFDGKSFTEYGQKDGLDGTIITAIAEDQDGHLWIGATWGGVTRFDGKTFQSFTEKEGMPNSEISSIVTDDDGRIWVGTPGGIGVIEKGKVVCTYAQKEGMQHVNVRSLFYDSNVLWIGTKAGLTKLEEDVFTHYNIPNPEEDEHVTCIAKDAEGAICIGTNKRIYDLDADRNQLVEKSIPMLPQGYPIKAIAKDSMGNVWTALEGYGIYKIGATITSYTSNNGLPDNNVSTLMVDRVGNLWVGTNGNGLLKFRGEGFTYYDYIEGLNTGNIFSILKDGNDIWVGTSTNGAYRYNGNEVVNYTTENGLPDNSVRSIIKGHGSTIWLATNKGLVQYNGRSLTSIDGPLKGKETRSLLLDSEGMLWIGTLGDYLYRYDGQNFQHYNSEDGLFNNNAHTLFQDSKGFLWVGSGGGMFRHNNGTFTHFKEGLCNSYVGSIVEDKNGHIWIGTDACIAVLKNDTFIPYTLEDGLTSNTVYLMVVDVQNQLWVGTNKGIDRIQLTENSTPASIKNYGLKEGFKGVECNSRAVYYNEDGHLWFGTVKGLIQYNPANDQLNTTPPQTHITNVRLFLQGVNWNDTSYSSHAVGWHHLPNKLHLPYDQNHLTFDFIGLDLSHPKKVRYSWMLEGFDKNWSPITQQNTTTYANLDPGTYTFKVKAHNSDGVWNEAYTTYENIVVAAPPPPPPPFWKTWWFYCLLGLVVFMPLYYFIVIRTKYLRVSKQILEERVRIRTQAISRQNEEKEVMLKEIHHRVKNNLQIISSLINLQSHYIEDERALELFDECKNRVNSMALIHEKIYESKDLANININEYISELINNLVKLYGMEPEIDLDLHIEVNSFKLDILVPIGLILNETISNSLKYAFEGRERGAIVVHLTRTANHGYRLLIADDGVGIPEGVTIENSETLGLQLIDILADQIDGNITLNCEHGTRYQIDF